MISRDLLNAVDPVGWSRRTLGFDPDANQQTILASSHKRILLNCSRQWGKSTVTAAKAVHRALEFPERMLRRKSFESLAAIKAAISELIAEKGAA